MDCIRILSLQLPKDKEWRLERRKVANFERDNLNENLFFLCLGNNFPKEVIQI